MLHAMSNAPGHEMLVFCLSENRDNNRMWAGYATDHTGFCVGIDSTSILFKERDRIDEFGTRYLFGRAARWCSRSSHDAPVPGQEREGLGIRGGMAVDDSCVTRELCADRREGLYLRTMDRADIKRGDSRISSVIAAGARDQGEDTDTPIFRCAKKPGTYELDIVPA